MGFRMNLRAFWNSASKPGKPKRRKLFIDRQVQGALLRRVALYWLVCLNGVFCILVGMPLLISWFAIGQPLSTGELLNKTLVRYWPVFVSALILLPIVLADCVRVSNRFAGPLFRLRRAMRDLADGKTVEPIRFRDGDFWTLIADDFNRVAARVQESRPTPDDSYSVPIDADEELVTV